MTNNQKVKEYIIKNGEVSGWELEEFAHENGMKAETAGREARRLVNNPSGNIYSKIIRKNGKSFVAYYVNIFNSPTLPNISGKDMIKYL